MNKRVLFGLIACLSGWILAGAGVSKAGDFEQLWHYRDEPEKMENALWGENAPERQFGNGRTTVVIADIKGPAVITMMHFALPQMGDILDRADVLLIYWDGEKTPSVEVPLVDFFCDANGSFSRVDNIVMNKKRGWNCYFQMPFRKSARVELRNDNPRYPMGVPSQNPCYSYVLYKKVKDLGADTLYFHATWKKRIWNQADEWYEILDARGRGQLVGWNVTMRPVDPKGKRILPDENELIYVDGEKTPSIEWQGIEDSFGFSWGFPHEDTSWLYMGCHSFYKTGKAAYRFFFSDRVPFAKSLRFKMGFSKEEGARWEKRFPHIMKVDCSTTAYWYQQEPHKPFEAFPSYAERQPVNVEIHRGKPSTEKETVSIDCGKWRGNEEIVYLALGWDFVFKQGFMGRMPRKDGQVDCWADEKDLKFDISCPAGVAGKLMLYIVDADKLGRQEKILVDGREQGEYADFTKGRWIEFRIGPEVTQDGVISVDVKRVKGMNAVVSKVRFELD